MAHILCKRTIGTRIRSAALVRNLSVEPTKLAALTYRFVDGMLEKRAPFRSDHLDILKTMSKEGDCLIGGAFAEPCDGSILLFSSKEKAQEFVDKDPYNTGGLVTSYQIRDYMAVVGSLLDK